MRKRKGTRSESEASKTLRNSLSDEAEGKGSGSGFFACYLLVSLNPRYKGHTYIGFTVNPRRRIRQHNGEIGCGAWRTKKRRPWEMVLCIYGFPTNVSALQFEWAWQHPVESLAVRKAAAGFKSLSGIANKIKLAYTMLTLPSWQSMNITVNFFSTKYTKHSAGCPSLPEHMRIEIGSMDELPCYTERLDCLSENEDDSIEEVEFDNNPSNSDSVPDAFDDSITHNSPKNPNCEAFGWNKESEARESGRSFTSEDQSQPFDSITSLIVESAPATSFRREEMTEDTDLMSEMNNSSAEFSQPERKQSGAISAANKNQQVSTTFIVPHEAEIIDLSTPSPSCRGFLDSKKRTVSCVGTDFIDLTKSPNFVQL